MNKEKGYESSKIIQSSSTIQSHEERVYEGGILYTIIMEHKEKMPPHVGIVAGRHALGIEIHKNKPIGENVLIIKVGDPIFP
jgi:hypothetical protein